MLANCLHKEQEVKPTCQSSVAQSLPLYSMAISLGHGNDCPDTSWLFCNVIKYNLISFLFFWKGIGNAIRIHNELYFTKKLWA